MTAPYNSNAIEGNTLTLSETKVVLEGITIGGRSIIEHLEVINHREAILFVEDLVSKKESLSEWNVRNIHALVLKGIDDQNAGKYRGENVVLSGSTHIPPKHYEIKHLMERLIAEYQNTWPHYHPVVRATLLHGEFVRIHPFVDGNGRTARLLLNLELMKNGFRLYSNHYHEQWCKRVLFGVAAENHRRSIEKVSSRKSRIHR